MKALSYTSARQNLSKTMEMVCDDHQPVIITRQREKSVVMISLEDYEAMEETAYLLKSPENSKRLMRSMEELKNGEGITMDLTELDHGFKKDVVA